MGNQARRTGAPRSRTNHQRKERPGSAETVRVVGYARVSTEDQATNGVSMDAQRERLEAYATAHGYHLVAIDSDNGTSGKVPPMKRDGLRRALRRIKAGEAEGVVFLKLDRLSRSARDVLDLAEEARRGHWHLMSVMEQLDTSTPMGKFALTLLGALAELERDQIAQRTKIGMAQIALEGRARSHRLPFGYRVDGEPGKTSPRRGDRRNLVEHPEEQAVMQRILRYREEGLGARRIANHLNADAIPNPRTGKPWNYSMVATIVRTWERRKNQAGVW